MSADAVDGSEKPHGSDDSVKEQSKTKEEEGDEEEWESFEEEYTLLAEVDGLDAALMQHDLSYTLVGTETDKPVLRIGEEFYEGHYVDTVGTDLFFDKNAASQGSGGTRPSLQECFVGQSTKRLVFKRIEVVPRETPEPSK